MSDDQEKTEEATPHKLEEARRKGDVAQSKEFATFVVFLGLVLGLYFTGPTILKNVVDVTRDSFDVTHYKVETNEGFEVIATSIINLLLRTIGPLFILVLFFGVAAYVGQFGFMFSLEKLIPKFSKINPATGIKKIFSKDTLVELIKSLFKIGVISAIMIVIVRAEMDELMILSSYSVKGIFIYFMSFIMKMIIAALLFIALLGLLDFSYQKWSYAEKMKMSQQEIKDENKQREGDPLVKSRIRQIQRDRARNRMMEEVPQATVVVTNPTHVAVALKYERGIDPAPIVVAKGAGEIAKTIKEIAMKANVPIVEKKALARYLYKNVEVKDRIPESLYTAVAEVLAYVYRLKKKFKSWQASQPAMA